MTKISGNSSPFIGAEAIDTYIRVVVGMMLGCAVYNIYQLAIQTILQDFGEGKRWQALSKTLLATASIFTIACPIIVRVFGFLPLLIANVVFAVAVLAKKLSVKVHRSHSPKQDSPSIPPVPPAPEGPILSSDRAHFVGIEKLKEDQRVQLIRLLHFAQHGQWNKIHDDHYDWEMFPINAPSNKGLAYKTEPSVVQQLKTDEDYMKRYREGVKLIFTAWGWDVETKSPLQVCGQGQQWTHYIVRIYKIEESLKLFEETELLESAQAFIVYHGIRDQITAHHAHVAR